MKSKPLNEITWLHHSQLKPNDYNPNVVFRRELKLLEASILDYGWIQPIMVTQDHVIIDGFHRFLIASQSKAVQKLHGHEVPCVVFTMSEAERQIATIRLNRAKGVHQALKMHDIVANLVHRCGIPPEEAAKAIGAPLEEIELLMQDDLFKALKVDEHPYSKAWVPVKS